MPNITGSWVGSTTGTPYPSLLVELQQSHAEIIGVAVFNEPGVGVFYVYDVRGQLRNKTQVTLRFSLRAAQAGIWSRVIDVNCKLHGEVMLTGVWTSAVGTEGVCELRRQDLVGTAKPEDERGAASLLDAQSKLVTASYNCDAAYTNFLLLGGYAGFFGLWQLTKEYLSKDQALWSALLVLISLLCFIVVEVAQMIRLMCAGWKKANGLNAATATSPPGQALARLGELESSLDRSIGPFRGFWVVSVAVCLLTALAGASILAYAFVSGLVQ